MSHDASGVSPIECIGGHEGRPDGGGAVNERGRGTTEERLPRGVRDGYVQGGRGGGMGRLPIRYVMEGSHGVSWGFRWATCTHGQYVDGHEMVAIS